MSPSHNQLLDLCVQRGLAGVQREYPSKIAHLLNGDEDVRPPRELTPVFYGCFDWHSAVHAHWMLVRCCRWQADGPYAGPTRDLLGRHLTPERLAGEVAYLEGPGRAGFERPYGLAWLLQLCAELHEWDDDEAQRWRAALEPLESVAAARFTSWLPRLTHPVRTGEHSQTAFAMGLLHDWARIRGRDDVARLVERRAREFHLDDRGWRLAFEPSGQDFLSPSLAEADLMRRVLEPEVFADWLDGLLPQLRDPGLDRVLAPAVVADASDGKLAHLDGLNLSRAWMLDAIVQTLPESDDRRSALHAAADAHRRAGLSGLQRGGYASTHWLGSFAVYLVTRRGIAGTGS